MTMTLMWYQGTICPLWPVNCIFWPHCALSLEVWLKKMRSDHQHQKWDGLDSWVQTTLSHCKDFINIRLGGSRRGVSLFGTFSLPKLYEVPCLVSTGEINRGGFTKAPLLQFSTKKVGKLSKTDDSQNSQLAHICWASRRASDERAPKVLAQNMSKSQSFW